MPKLLGSQERFVHISIIFMFVWIDRFNLSMGRSIIKYVRLLSSSRFRWGSRVNLLSNRIRRYFT